MMSVRLATKKSKGIPNGVVVQDTAWEGYEETKLIGSGAMAQWLWKQPIN